MKRLNSNDVLFNLGVDNGPGNVELRSAHLGRGSGQPMDNSFLAHFKMKQTYIKKTLYNTILICKILAVNLTNYNI